MKKQSAIYKNFFREIKSGMGRFLSILFIVALGTSFFAGIRSTESAMKITGDAYYDNTNLMDIKLVSTLGFTDDDVEEIAKLENIEKAAGSYSVDVLHIDDERQATLHVMALVDGMNDYLLLEGEIPDAKGECLIDAQYIGYDSSWNTYGIGDKITLKSGTDDDLEDTLENLEYTITGIVNTPQYMAFQRGNTTIGNGEISGYMVVIPEEFVKADVYTEVYAMVKGAKAEVAYSAAYQDKVEKGIDEIKGIEDERKVARKDEVIKDATKKLEEAREEFTTEQAKAEKELTDAHAKIQDAEKELTDGKSQIADGEKALNDGKAELSRQQKNIDAGWESYNKGKADLEQAKKDYIAGKNKYDSEYDGAIAQFEVAEQQLVVGKAQLEAEKEAFEAMKPYLTLAQIAEGEAKLLVAEQEIQKGEQEITVGRNELANAKRQLDSANSQIVSGERELSSARSQLINGQSKIDSAWTQIPIEEQKLTYAKQKIAEGEVELEEGKAEYEEGRKEADEEFAKAEKELADAEKDIGEIKEPTWYIEDRDVLLDYTSFGDNATRMQAIGKVFPAIFFMVAALISLTAMTRMIEEQRIQIGTLKALGYSKITIAMKYLGYAFLATLLGSALGVLVGGKLFPTVIISAYMSMYEGLPEIIVPYHVGYVLMASLAAILATLGATLLASYRELAMRPAVLMRPPSPKKGKRVFLERVPFIWKHLSFTWKSTIRNLVRYKKRFMMTVLGIGACMGLMLIGFGLRDSILDVARLQFRTIQFAEETLYLEDDLSEEKRQAIVEKLDAEKGVDNYMDFYTRTSTIQKGKFKEDVYVMIPKDTRDLSKFFSFRDRVGKTEHILGTDEVILTEKAAKTLDVKTGDSIELKLNDYEVVTVDIAAITENYLLHYLYISPELYQQLYGEEPVYNSIQLNVDETKENSEIFAIGESLMKLDGVQSVSYASTMMGSMDDMLASLDLVLIILTISAGLLAFVVLYNLNTININERRRELATIKVLGFFDREVSAYVYRENVLLTIIGVIAGCFFGRLMHYFVITTVEVELVMFGRNINLPSFVYSIIFTVLFSILVNAVMYLKLKKIDMVESLKSAE